MAEWLWYSGICPYCVDAHAHAVWSWWRYLIRSITYLYIYINVQIRANMFKHCVQMCSKVQTCAKLCKIVQTLLTCDASSVLIFHVNAAKTHLLQFGICMKSGALGSCPRHIAEVSWIKVLRATYRNKSTPELQESWGIGLSYHIINSYHISEFWGFNAFSEATWDLWTWLDANTARDPGELAPSCNRLRQVLPGLKLESKHLETPQIITDLQSLMRSEDQWSLKSFEKNRASQSYRQRSRFAAQTKFEPCQAVDERIWKDTLWLGATKWCAKSTTALFAQGGRFFQHMFARLLFESALPPGAGCPLPQRSAHTIRSM